MNQAMWKRWLLQTARNWDDISGLITTIGITSVDRDHRNFTEYLLELNLLIEAGRTNDTNLPTLDRQRDFFQRIHSYVRDHFDREMNIMVKNEYPGIEHHKRQHDIFVQTVNNHIHEYQNNLGSLNLALKNSLLSWWVDHINMVDYHTFVTGEKWYEGGKFRAEANGEHKA